MTIPPLPLPGAIQARLDIIRAKPLLQRAPKLSEAIVALVTDAAARRQDVARPALALADRHKPVRQVFDNPAVPPFTHCGRCAGHPKWPCREAEIAAQMLRSLGHPLPHQVPLTAPARARRTMP